MNFGIVVFNQVEELDFLGPWDTARRPEEMENHYSSSHETRLA
jgi:hypothetical protein